MKRFSWMVLVAALLMTACSSDSDLLEDNNNGGTEQPGTPGDNGNSGSVTYSSSISDLMSFDISLDTSALTETETIPTEGDEAEDYIENNSFKNNIAIAFDGTSATASGSVDGVTVSINGADVVINSSAKKVSYTVSGTTSDGFLKMKDTRWMPSTIS